MTLPPEGPDEFDAHAAEATPCFVRQPILDERARVFGYELFYERPHAAGDDEDATLVSARILSDAVRRLGLDVLSGGRPVFLKLTHDLLLNGSATLLSPSRMVVELDPGISVDRAIVEACRRLSESGYAIGLDSAMVGDQVGRTLMPFAKFVKVDVARTTSARRTALVAELRSSGVRLIAQSVETPDVAAELRGAGYRLFQGRYFCTPTPVGSTRISGNRIAYLRLLGALNRTDLSVTELEDLVKHDASLCVRVLQSINSPAYGLRREIWSIRQAIVLLGHEQIRKWASVWVLSELNVVGIDEMLSMALVRARACELLEQQIAEADEQSGGFLLGLCSVLDVLIGQPLPQILSDLPLPRPIEDALLGRQSSLRPVLDVVIAYEQGRWDRAAALAGQAGVDVASLPTIYASALAWVPALQSSDPAA